MPRDYNSFQIFKHLIIFLIIFMKPKSKDSKTKEVNQEAVARIVNKYFIILSVLKIQY
jgi:hypothetical protein